MKSFYTSMNFKKGMVESNTASQATSMFVYNLSQYITEAKEEPIKENLEKGWLDLVNLYPENDQIGTFVYMLKNNRILKKHFNADQKQLNKVVDVFFGNCNNSLEIMDNMQNFIRASKEPDKLDQFLTSLVQSKVKEKEYISEFYKTGVLDPQFIKNRFPRNLEQWKVKEATAWVVTYVENCATPEELRNHVVIGANGFTNKYKTFDNLIKKINEIALVEKQPFTKKDDRFVLSEAGSGDIDVMLWDQKNSKIVVACATRDRGYKVEGNQFFRHYLRAATIAEEIKNQTAFYSSDYMKEKYPDKWKFFKERSLSENGEIKPGFVRGFINKSFKKDDFYQKHMDGALKRHQKHLCEFDSSLLKEIEVENNHTNYSFNKEFLVERLRQREKGIAIGYRDDNLNIISSNEIEHFIHKNKKMVDFVFFGEVLAEKYDQRVLAGLNAIAYRDNFNKIGSLSFDTEASSVFMRNIRKRYNNISALDLDVETYGQKHIINMIKNTEEGNLDFMASDAHFFSKQNTFTEERACLFKSLSVMFKTVNESIENFNDKIEEGDTLPNQKNFSKDLNKGIKTFFNGKMEKDDILFIEDFMTDRKKINRFVQQISENIQCLNSEVPMELTELRANAKSLNRNIRHFKAEEAKYEKELELEKAQEEILEIKKLLAEKEALLSKQKVESKTSTKKADNNVSEKNDDSSQNKKKYYRRKPRTSN